MIRRTFTFPLEVRADTEKPIITGYAAVFAPALSLDLGGYRETLKPGCFTKTLSDKDNDVLALWSHDWSKPLARRSAETLKLTEDEKGLLVEIQPDETSWGKDAIASVRSHTVQGMSFGFEIDVAQWDHNAKVRTLVEVSLYEVSLTPYPAYPDTEANVRSALAELQQSFSSVNAAQGDSHALRHLRYQLLRLKCPR